MLSIENLDAGITTATALKPTGLPQAAGPTRWHDADDIRWAARQWAARIGVPLRSVTLRPMTQKWASISTAGRLTLDTGLLDLDRGLGEFVLVHELVHLLCPEAGHGRVFTSFMMAYMPDWEARQSRLNDVLSRPQRGGRT
jgi:predicted metal-dependent hydrolase